MEHIVFDGVSIVNLFIYSDNQGFSIKDLHATIRLNYQFKLSSGDTEVHFTRNFVKLTLYGYTERITIEK